MKPRVSSKCQFINSIFDTWLESASLEQRKTFTKDFFDALEAGGVKRISDLSGSGISEIESILTALTTQSHRGTKIVIGKFLRSVFRTFRSIDFRSLIKSRAAVRGIVFFVVGLLFMIVPDIATRGISLGLGVISLIWLGKRLLTNAFSVQDEDKRKKWKLIFYMSSMCVISFLISKTNLMLQFTNLLVGAFLMYWAYQQICCGVRSSMNICFRVLRFISGIALFLLGIVPILFHKITFAPYAGVAGVCISFYGMLRFVSSMYRNGKQNMKNTD